MRPSSRLMGWDAKGPAAPGDGPPRNVSAGRLDRPWDSEPGRGGLGPARGVLERRTAGERDPAAPRPAPGRSTHPAHGKHEAPILVAVEGTRDADADHAAEEGELEVDGAAYAARRPRAERLHGRRGGVAGRVGPPGVPLDGGRGRDGGEDHFAEADGRVEDPRVEADHPAEDRGAVAGELLVEI